MGTTKRAETAADAVTFQAARVSSPRCANSNTRRAYAGVIDNLITTRQLLARLVSHQERWAAPPMLADCERLKEHVDHHQGPAQGGDRATTVTPGRAAAGEDAVADALKDRGASLGDPGAQRRDLDLDNREAAIQSKGGEIEWVYWG